MALTVSRQTTVKFEQITVTKVYVSTVNRQNGMTSSIIYCNSETIRVNRTI